MNLIKKPVAELEGAALDYAVAKAEGRKTRIYMCPLMEQYAVAATILDGDIEDAWMPTLSWADCGPLIEKYSVSIERRHDGWWLARILYVYDEDSAPIFIADTPLIAACRTIVASVLGTIVEIPAELAA